jgi:hypothetical protein
LWTKIGLTYTNKQKLDYENDHLRLSTFGYCELQ